MKEAILSYENRAVKMQTKNVTPSPIYQHITLSLNRIITGIQRWLNS